MKARLSNADFVKACVEAKGIKELAEKTGLSETTCQQKRVALRKAGWPIEEYTRGGGAKGARKNHTPTQEDMEALAKLRGVTVEQLQLEAVKVVTTQSERSAAIKAGQAAARAT